MDKSPEAFRTISEVAEYLETPAHVLRFWESRFPQIRPVKRAGGRRYYRPGDVALIAGIRKLLHEDGMTIRGVQKILREQGVRHVAALVAGAAAAEAVTPDDDAEDDTFILATLPGQLPLVADGTAAPTTAKIYTLETPAPATAQIIRIGDLVGETPTGAAPQTAVDALADPGEPSATPSDDPGNAEAPDGPQTLSAVPAAPPAAGVTQSFLSESDLPDGPDNIFAEAFDPPAEAAPSAAANTNQQGDTGPDSSLTDPQPPASPSDPATTGQIAIATRPLVAVPPARRLSARLRALAHADSVTGGLTGDPALVALHLRLSDLRARIAQAGPATKR